MDTPETIFTQGLYPLPEAARLAQLDARAARLWAEGYDFTYRGERHHSAGVMGLALSPAAGVADLTFAEMLTLRLVKGFRDTGLSLRTVKRVAEVAARDFGTPTPFVSQRFRTDGVRVFMELQHIEPANDEPGVTRHERELIEILSRQRAFVDIVEPSLFERLDWADDIAARWWPMGRDRAVVLDPLVMFGAPRISGTRISTVAAASAVKVEGGSDAAIEAVADWYGTKPRHVRDALDLETSWFRRAA